MVGLVKALNFTSSLPALLGHEGPFFGQQIFAHVDSVNGGIVATSRVYIKQVLSLKGG